MPFPSPPRSSPLSERQQSTYPQSSGRPFGGQSSPSKTHVSFAELTHLLPSALCYSCVGPWGYVPRRPMASRDVGQCLRDA